MALRDVADKFNKKHEAIRKAEEERIRQSELGLRRLSYYNEFGPAWFQDLTVAIDRLIIQFNDLTGEHTKLKRVVLEPLVENCIALLFLEASEAHLDHPPTGMLRRDSAELKLSLAIQHSKFPYEEHYEVIVKNLQGLKVRISEVKEVHSLGEGYGIKDRETGQTDYFPTFVTRKVKSTKELNPDEFADHILSTFAEKML